MEKSKFQYGNKQRIYFSHIQPKVNKINIKQPHGKEVEENKQKKKLTNQTVFIIANELEPFFFLFNLDSARAEQINLLDILQKTKIGKFILGQGTTKRDTAETL